MEKSFYTGKGIGVCILDTGIYEHIDFTGRIWTFYDFLDFKRRPYDDNGHGTHVAGLVAGDGTASMGKYRGAAPGCGIIALKVLDRYGNGSQDDVLRALRWIREYRQYHSSGKQQKSDHSGLQRFVGRAQCYFRERTNGGMRVQAGYCGTWK